MKARLFFLPAPIAILLYAVGNAQSLLPDRAEDPFIATIQAMKSSVAPVVCLSLKGKEPTVLSRPGSAFFVTRAGDFLTAAHVLDQNAEE